MNQDFECPTDIAIVHGQLTHGGSERQLYMLLQHCDRKRWRPHLYLSGELGVWEASVRALDIPVILLHGNPIAKMWQFRRLCRAARIRRFMSWGAYTNGYALALAGLGIPCVGSFRNAHFDDLPKRGRWFWTWLSLSGVASIVCNSQETLATMQNRVKAHQRLVYIPNGVQAITDVTSHRAQWRRRLEIDDQEILVVGVGRLSAQKNFSRFIDAIVLANQTCRIKAVIAGPDLGLRSTLQRQIKAAHLTPGTIRLIGPVPDARELMCAADIFMLSSDFEGMPNVVLEAMAAGVPCVSTRVNSMAEIIEQGVQGWVTEHRPDALAQVLLQLAQDPALRHLLGENAKARVAHEYAPVRFSQRLWQLCE